MLDYFLTHQPPGTHSSHSFFLWNPDFFRAFMVLISIAFVTAPGLSASTNDPNVNDSISAEEQTIIDDVHKVASETLFDTAEWFDSFFDDTRYDAELNKSRAKLKLSTKITDDGDIDISPRFQWRIHLPKISRKTNLILFGSEDDDDDFGSGTNDSPSDEDRSRDDFGAAIQQFFKIGEKYNISGTFGLSSSAVYTGLRYRYYLDLGPWQSRIVERLRYYTDDGWENTLSLDLERHISSNWLFRSTASLNWYENEDGLPYDLSFNFYRFISERRALALEWYNSFETRPTHELADIQLQFRYRQRLHRKWLLYEIKPRVNFREENDRDPEFSLYFILEAKFGREEGKRIRNVFHF
ncbi:hypothetical protein [Desulfopila sp. IMCC35008]|uniref:hypothetical protein n=1 Tax=Desulfopila sp. IMCC35008 TaxID=2653858 RepID=UPI0013D4FEEA|nr:hypothetical protein [Desulfopila sp. IMCC35008]